MTETHDLVTRLLAAIAETEAAITQYRDHRAGADPCINYEGQAPEHYTEWDSCWRHIVTAQATPYSDVDFGLRGCAADRKIVELHSPEQAGDVGPPRCRTCHGESWILDEGEDSGGTVYQEAQWRGEPPCATLLALAERYDLAEQRQDQP